ncbi:Imm26 family immunity protein [Flavobacterium aestivum]|uniref:Imm26 family immunity protein n=1 Tax=Flavobacterium aestivum TaxID=3003257 RepID=UPI0024831A8D|nr:Imm26 family immunity protein [Flavobacterium aestivum]
MNKRQKITTGSILEINIENKYYVYAQILSNGDGIVFFDYKSPSPLKDFSILENKPVLFIITVYNDVITKGHWLKVGKLGIRKEFEILPLKFIQDAQHPDRFEFYNPNTGDITPTTKDKIKGLERAAVWDANHVEDRIRSHYEGTTSIWMKEDLELFKE